MPQVPCYPDIALVGKWAGQVVGKINTGAGIDRRSFPLEGSIVLACLALPCLPACQASLVLRLSIGAGASNQQHLPASRPLRAPFPRILLRWAILASWTLFSFFFCC